MGTKAVQVNRERCIHPAHAHGRRRQETDDSRSVTLEGSVLAADSRVEGIPAFPVLEHITGPVARSAEETETQSVCGPPETPGNPQTDGPQAV